MEKRSDLPDAGAVRRVLSRLKGIRVLVIGDIVLDEFIWGSVRRISPEAPVPVVEVTRENRHLGGAANVVNNILSLGAQSVLCGAVGDDPAGENVLDLLRKTGGGIEGIVVCRDRPTSVKTRVIAQHQQVVRFDRETKDGISQKTRNTVLSFIDEAIPRSDAVIISDYGKGMVSRHLVQAVLRGASRKGIIVCVDPKPENTALYRGVTVVTPNVQEAQGAVGFPLSTERDVERGAEAILKLLGCSAVVITRGEHGMTILERGKRPVHIPTVAKEVFDVTGAGDTVIAALTACHAAGASLRHAAIIANHAAGIVVGKLGTATATREEIIDLYGRPGRTG